MMTEDEVPSVNPKLDAMCEMLKAIDTLTERNKTLEKRLAKAEEYLNLLLMDSPDVYRITGKTIPRILSEVKQFLKETEENG